MKIFSDPVHGFISVPRGLILDLIQTPEVQRLRRIRQLGVGYLVFPGAEHTRFGHALGAMALMQDALATLQDKGTPITPEEHTAALAAALLHDLGHGPFSHTLENELIAGFHHEKMSRVMLAHLNERFDGALDRTIALFDDTYERPFFHQLIASQLDMDRLDYLRRDSFYTGVVEGKVGVDRIIKTMRVHPPEGGPGSRIVIEAKGTYAVENFLIARRLMYWQVYLHKTVLAGDHLLRAILRRVRHHLQNGTGDVARGTAPAFLFFLRNHLTADDLARDDVRTAYTALDDTDILFSLKQWRHHTDPVLADLCRRFVDRDFFRVTFLDAPPSEAQQARWRDAIAAWLVRSGRSTAAGAPEDAAFYLATDTSRHYAYDEGEAESIRVLDRHGTVRELSRTTDTAAVSALTRYEEKPYVCYPKEVTLTP
ncbi:HD domain-containing protein [Rhodocaloribacter litoris]|uniref:HD domain-containing protein n=1 Tax=Rhodocaloribacter litoris TaxID=2558931 RepID=UPI001E521E6A|nr:HD domain-containing protein [Rhodocaloribacter litoris]